MKKLFAFFLLLSVLYQSYSQTANSKKDLGLIIGNVLDLQTGKPVAFATLVLYKKIDSTKKITQVADKNGAFEFEKLSFGYYRLTFTAIGFYKIVRYFVFN